MSNGRLQGMFAGVLAGLLAVVLILSIARTATLTDAIRQTQKVNTLKADQRDEQLRIVKRVARQIESCTTPGEPCSKRGQRQTAKALGNIDASDKRNAAASSSCAARIPNPTYPRVYRCTLRTLNHAGRAP